MKKTTNNYEKKAIDLCKSFKNNSIAYKESMLYAAYGSNIGLKKCSEIASKY